MEDEEQNKSTSDIETTKILQDLFADADARKAYVKAMARGRPRMWKKSSTATYYAERYALELKAVVDQMIKDQQNYEYRYSEFPHLSRNTVYLRINQSKMYLLQELDFDGSYKRFFEGIRITREPSGVAMKFIRVGDQDMFMPSKVVTFGSTADVMEAIDEFLEDSSRKQVELLNLNLDAASIALIKESLSNLEHIAANIESDRLKIIKMI